MIGEKLLPLVLVLVLVLPLVPVLVLELPLVPVFPLIPVLEPVPVPKLELVLLVELDVTLAAKQFETSKYEKKRE